MEIEATLERLHVLVDATSVTGCSIAVVQNGRVELAAAGKRDASTGVAVDTDTVFDVASLTKPLVAFAALQLVDAGVLDLDEPVADFSRPVVPDDPRSSKITVRHLLTHTSGLQNIRGKDSLRLFFEPGSWFSYSSVGFMYLQLAVESKTRERLESTLRRLVFEPLGMHSSSLEWQGVYAENEALPHDAGQQLPPHRPVAANASYSLKTTAGDYGAFVRAVLTGDRLRAQTLREWFAPVVMVPLGQIERLHGRPEMTEPGVGWGLGWGVEPVAGTFFQWGKMPGVRSFVMGSRSERVGLVVLTNSNTGLRLALELAAVVLPGEHPALRWVCEGVPE